MIALLIGFELKDELFSRRNAVILVQNKTENLPCLFLRDSLKIFTRRHPLNCSYIQTDKGNYRLPTITLGPFNTQFQWVFWNEESKYIWDSLKVGCTYKVVVVGSYATTTIAGVVKQLGQKTDQC